MLGVKREKELDQMIVYGIFGASALSIFLLLIASSKYDNRVKKCELIELAKETSLHSLDKINEEEEIILNPKNTSFTSETLLNKEIYAKNRKKDLVKIKKYAKTKTTVSAFWIVLGTTFAIVPILEFGLNATMIAFGQTMIKLLVDNIDISLFALGAMGLHLILLILFRKRNFPYYLIYIYMFGIVVVSVLL